jgi:starvation-inducible DNA-binding protein
MSMRNGKSTETGVRGKANLLNEDLQAHEEVTERFAHLAAVRIGLDVEVRHKSVAALNRMLAHSLAIRDLYKKCHWQTSGATFYQLHLLFDKHYAVQEELVDAIAERVQLLGGVAQALAADVVQESRLSRVTRSRETPTAELNGLLDAHEFILKEARALAREAAQRGDDGTNDLLVSQVIRAHELQTWFIGEHLDGV